MMNTIMYEGEINVGTCVISCYVLDNGRRVISEDGMYTALKLLSIDNFLSGIIDAAEMEKLSRYFNEKMDSFKCSKMECLRNTEKTIVYDSWYLLDICEMFMDAKKDYVLNQNQYQIVRRAEIIMCGLARAGISALIDDAVGRIVK